MLLDLGHVAGPARGATWCGWVQQLFRGGLTVAEVAEAMPATGRIELEALGPGSLMRLENPAMRILRQPALRDLLGPLWVVMLVERGGAQVSHAGRRCRLEAGQLFWLDGRLDMDYRGGATALTVAHLPRDLVWQHCPAATHLAGTAVDLRRHAGARRLAETLRGLCGQLPTMSPAQRTAALEALARMHGLVAPLGPAAVGSSAPVREAWADIERHLGDPLLTPTRLAAMQGLSRRHLDTLMRRQTGNTLDECLWERRLVRAAARLADPRLAYCSVTEIALDTGFSSSAHFSRRFKARHGQAPSEWRRRAQRPAA